MKSQPSSHNEQSLESISEYAQRTSSQAATAADSVTDTFVHRILGVPGALIGSVQVPRPAPAEPASEHLALLVAGAPAGLHD